MKRNRVLPKNLVSVAPFLYMSQHNNTLSDFYIDNHRVFPYLPTVPSFIAETLTLEAKRHHRSTFFR